MHYIYIYVCFHIQSFKMTQNYQINQLYRTATTNEVKEAYRKLALVFHPDRNDGCEKKASRFKAVSEAYQTLSGEL